MENYFAKDEQTNSLNNLLVDEQGKYYLLDTARWGRFIGIVYSIAIFLVCLLFRFAMVNNPQYETVANSGSIGLLMVFYLAFMIGINFYPLYAIIKSASQARKGIGQNNQFLLNDSFRLTRNLYKYLGILTIVLLCFYGLFIVFFITIFATATAF